MSTRVEGAEPPVILITAKATLAAEAACLMLTVTEESANLGRYNLSEKNNSRLCLRQDHHDRLHGCFASGCRDLRGRLPARHHRARPAGIVRAGPAMTQVPRAEAGQAEAWVTSPNYGEFLEVTVGLQCPVHCLLQAFNPLIPRWPERGPARLATASCSCCFALGKAATAGRGDLDDELAHPGLPVPGHRLAPRRAAAGPLDAGRGGDLRSRP